MFLFPQECKINAFREQFRVVITGEFEVCVSG